MSITPLGGGAGGGRGYNSVPSLNFPTSSGLFNITTTPLTMVHTIANATELLGIPLPEDEPRTKTARSTKVYIGKIPSGISDYFMEQLFLRCGPINSWTRCLDSSGKPMPYGFIEFQTVEGMLRCLRLLNGMQLMGNKLVVRVDFQTEFFIKEWSDLKRAEWERKKLDTIMTRDKAREITFEEFLTCEDKSTEYQIQLLIHNLEQTHEEDPIQKEEDCEHVREKEREKRLRARNRDVDKVLLEKEREWLQREENQERERVREKEREDEQQRERIRLIHRDLNYDTDDESNRRKKRSKKWLRAREERKHQRETEREEDAQNARKEFEALFPGVATLEEKLEQAKELERLSGLTSEFALPTPSISLQIEVKPVDELKAQRKCFALEGEDEEDALYHRKHKVLALAAEETAPVLHSVQTTEQTMTEEDFKKQVDRLKGLLDRVPQRKAELYDFPLDWNKLAQTHVLDKKLGPFISKLFFEYVGEVERGFVQKIVRQVANREEPAKIQEYLGQVLDKDSEVRDRADFRQTNLANVGIRTYEADKSAVTHTYILRRNYCVPA